MNRQRVMLVGLSLAALACGGDDGGGTTTPPPPAPVLGSIVPSVTTLTLGAGQAQTISATARDANNAPMTAAGYTFTSSAPTVAQVTTAGRVIGLTAGAATVTISLTLGGVTRTAPVAVTVSGTLPQAVTVAAGATSNDFTPDLVAVARGGTVTWTFGQATHNVEFGTTPGAPARVPNSQNTSVSRTFANAGNFAYTCTLHANQNGAVIVP